MAQFVLTWDNTAVLANSNATAQRALYRVKSVGGAFSSTGFTPTNDLAKSATTSTSPVLSSNIVYEFKVQAICTENGPTDNDNGIVEKISFQCIVPDTEVTATTSNISIDVTGLDITKAKFTLKKSSDNSVVYTGTINRVGDSVSTTATGLTGSTNYYWQVELYATVNSIDVVSSGGSFLGAACGPYPITTSAPPVCNPVTSVDVSSIEIP
jgi:hypothetical protein